jgi:hypothetical protein
VDWRDRFGERSFWYLEREPRASDGLRGLYEPNKKNRKRHRELCCVVRVERPECKLLKKRTRSSYISPHLTIPTPTHASPRQLYCTNYTHPPPSSSRTARKKKQCTVARAPKHSLRWLRYGTIANLAAPLAPLGIAPWCDCLQGGWRTRGCAPKFRVLVLGSQVNRYILLGAGMQMQM